MAVRTLPGSGLIGAEAGDDNWADAHNDSMRILSALSAGAISRTTTPPGTGSPGDIYVYPFDDGTYPDYLAIWDGPSGSEVWNRYAPVEGWTILIEDEGARVQYESGAWGTYGAGGTLATEEDGVSVDATTDTLNFLSPLTATAGAGSQVDVGVNGGATLGSNGTWRGATVGLTADDTAVDFSSIADYAGWDNEINDTDGFWASSPNPSRLTVPSGSGITKVRLTAAMLITTTTAGANWFIAIRKNGTTNQYVGHGSANLQAGHATAGLVTVTSGVIDVSEGDYFEVRVLGAGESSETVEADGAYFQIEVVEPFPVKTRRLEKEYTGSDTLVASDAIDAISYNSGSAGNLTIDGGDFAEGDHLIIRQAGTGVATLVAGSGMTLNSRGSLLDTAGQHAIIEVLFHSDSVATVYGDRA